MKEWSLGTEFVFVDGRSESLTLCNFRLPEWERLRRWPLEPDPRVAKVKLYEDRRELDSHEARRELLDRGEFPPVACRPMRLRRKVNVFALDIHTEKGVGNYWRTPIADVIYELKYRYEHWGPEEREHFLMLAASSMHFYLRHKNHIAGIPLGIIDAIVPLPPSKRDRPFQPVYSLAEALGRITNLPVFYILDQLGGSPIKNTSPAERNKALMERIRVMEKGPFPKHILLLDDLVDSGATMNAAISRLQERGVKHIYPVAFTATRTVGALARKHQMDP